MKININLNEYNVFFENSTPVVVKISDSRRIASLLIKYSSFEKIPDDEKVNAIYLTKVKDEYILVNSKLFELDINTLNRPALIEIVDPK